MTKRQTARSAMAGPPTDLQPKTFFSEEGGTKTERVAAATEETAASHHPQEEMVVSTTEEEQQEELESTSQPVEQSSEGSSPRTGSENYSLSTSSRGSTNVAQLSNEDCIYAKDDWIKQKLRLTNSSNKEEVSSTQSSSKTRASSEDESNLSFGNVGPSWIPAGSSAKLRQDHQLGGQFGNPIIVGHPIISRGQQQNVQPFGQCMGHSTGHMPGHSLGQLNSPPLCQRMNQCLAQSFSQSIYQPSGGHPAAGQPVAGQSAAGQPAAGQPLCQLLNQRNEGPNNAINSRSNVIITYNKPLNADRPIIPPAWTNGLIQSNRSSDASSNASPFFGMPSSSKCNSNCLNKLPVTSEEESKPIVYSEDAESRWRRINPGQNLSTASTAPQTAPMESVGKDTEDIQDNITDNDIINRQVEENSIVEQDGELLVELPRVPRGAIKKPWWSRPTNKTVKKRWCC